MRLNRKRAIFKYHRNCLPPPPGGYFHMYAYWVCAAAREIPIFSPEFLFRSISFSQKSTKKSIPEHTIFYIFLADFAVPETVIFKLSLISTRSSPPTAGSARTQSVRQRRGLAAVPEIRIFTLKTDQARSGAPHFHARPGACSGALAHIIYTYQKLG